MAYPTLACKYTALCVPAFACHTQPAPLQFNQINIIDDSGAWLGTFTCDPDLSAFLPAHSRDPITSAEFNALWPMLLLIFVVGFGVKMLLRVFKSRGV